jgi:hypothetical protein
MPKRTKLLSQVGLAKQPASPLNPSGPSGGFFFDPSSVAQARSAAEWADKVWTQDHHYCKGSWVLVSSRTSTPVSSIVQTIPKVPMKNLRFLDIDTRLEGGRAYKVVDSVTNAVFDVREDQVAQAILKYGIAPDGIIGGEWVWAMNHNQPKCYLVDGVEYQAMLQEHGFSSHSEVVNQ